MSESEGANQRACEHASMATYPVPNDLPALAETVARWVDDVEEVPAVYLFGSRVRGDHRPDSDVDLCLFLAEWGDGSAGADWWVRQNRTDFADLKIALPGRLEVHRDQPSAGHRWVDDARADPSRIVLRVRKAVCVWTTPKTMRSREGQR